LLEKVGKFLQSWLAALGKDFGMYLKDLGEMFIGHRSARIIYLWVLLKKKLPVK
jgi:hypothetical protein